MHTQCSVQSKFLNFFLDRSSEEINTEFEYKASKFESHSGCETPVSLVTLGIPHFRFENTKGSMNGIIF